MTGIKEIFYVDGLGNSPAAINAKTGYCLININRIDDFTPQMWRWILQHESAHAEFRTSNEFFVDRIAFNRLLLEGMSMKDIISQSRKFLHIKFPQSRDRIGAMLEHGYNISQKLQKYNLDYTIISNRIEGMRQYRNELLCSLHDAFEKKDGNKALALAEELRAVASTKAEIDLVDGAIQEIKDLKNETHSAGGKGFLSKLKTVASDKKAKKDAKKEAKETRKQEKHEAQVDIKKARANKIAHTGEAKLAAAQNGIDINANKRQMWGDGLKAAAGISGAVTSALGGGAAGGAVEGALNAISSMVGGGNGDAQNTDVNQQGTNIATAQQEADAEALAKAEKSKKTKIWVIIGGVITLVLVIGGVVFYMWKRKKVSA